MPNDAQESNQLSLNPRDKCVMQTEFILPLATFAFVTSVTPGPNNLMLMASGANFGFRRTVPHMLGVALGFVFLAIVVGLGLASLFTQWPWLYDVLMVVSGISRSADRTSSRRPLPSITASGTERLFR